MPTRLYRAERCRNPADEWRAVLHLYSVNRMQAHYSRMAEHYSKLAKAEELSTLPAREA